jgi:hypothetical protein
VERIWAATGLGKIAIPQLAAGHYLLNGIP